MGGVIYGVGNWISHIEEEAKKAGFETVEEMENAAEAGYRTRAAYERRYLDFGFLSLAEMLALQGRGYRMKLEYLRVKQFTPQSFVDTCLNVNRIRYAYKCRGRRISWTVELTAWEDDEARLRVLDTGAPAKANGFSVDSDTFISALSIIPVLGAQFEIDARVGARRFRYPDIEEVTYAARLAE